MEDEYDFTEEESTPSKQNPIGDAARVVGIAVGAVFLLAFGVACAPSLKNIFGGERQGAVEIEDCREYVQVEEGSFTTYINKFTCYSGFCCRVEVEDGFCRTAFCYKKTRWVSKF